MAEFWGIGSDERRRRIGVGKEEETEKRTQTQTQKQMHTNGTEPDYCKSLAMADVISRRALGLDLKSQEAA